MPATETILRKYVGGEKRYNIYGVNGTSKIFGGSFVALDSDGYAVPLTDSETIFAGIAEEDVDNTDGADGEKQTRVVSEADVEMDVTGVAGPDDVNATVFAGADDQVDLADASSDVPIGKVVQHIAGTRCIVKVQATARRSL